MLIKRIYIMKGERAAGGVLKVTLLEGAYCEVELQTHYAHGVFNFVLKSGGYFHSEDFGGEPLKRRLKCFGTEGLFAGVCDKKTGKVLMWAGETPTIPQFLLEHAAACRLPEATRIAQVASSGEGLTITDAEKSAFARNKSEFAPKKVTENVPKHTYSAPHVDADAEGTVSEKNARNSSIAPKNINVKESARGESTERESSAVPKHNAHCSAEASSATLDKQRVGETPVGAGSVPCADMPDKLCADNNAFTDNNTLSDAGADAAFRAGTTAEAGGAVAADVCACGQTERAPCVDKSEGEDLSSRFGITGLASGEQELSDEDKAFDLSLVAEIERRYLSEPHDEQLELLAPGSHWIKNDSGKSFSLGVLYNTRGATHVCYATRGERNLAPSFAAEWLAPPDSNEGYWVVYEGLYN